MSNSSDNILMDEYKQFSTAAESLLASSFQVPAVAVAIVTALAISGKVNTEYFGFGVLVGMFLLSIWLGFYHSTLNRYWLHLVEIEKKVNSTLGKKPSEGLTYYSNFVGVARTGTGVYVWLLAFLFSVGFGFSVWHTWIISQSWNWKLGKTLVSVGLVILTLVSFCNIRRTEKKFVGQKKEILDRYGASGSSNNNSGADTKL